MQAASSTLMCHALSYSPCIASLVQMTGRSSSKARRFEVVDVLATSLSWKADWKQSSILVAFWLQTQSPVGVRICWNYLLPLQLLEAYRPLPVGIVGNTCCVALKQVVDFVQKILPLNDF